MEARDAELGEVLEYHRRNLIPTYQRDYEWNEEGQWELLMDDVLGVAERLEEARQIAAEHPFGDEDYEERVGPHFLGAVVLQPLKPRGTHVAEASVIDGQQRLTTIYLLMRGVLDVVERLALKDRADQVHMMIYIEKRGSMDPEEIYKLWPRRRDRNDWIEAMAAHPSDSSHAYSQARRYFSDRIEATLEGLGVDEQLKRIECIVDAIRYKVKIVVVHLENLDDAQLIFEVLNGRQTPLSASDLVKNLLFMRVNLKDEQLDKLYDTYWRPFDDPWWSERVGRGHAARGRRDQLLATWLTVRRAEEVNLGRLYGQARQFLRSTKEPLPVILASIHDLAREYRQIYERTSDVPESIAEVYRRVERLGVTTAVPLLAWLRTLPDESMKPEQHERAVGYVDAWVTRGLITGVQTRGYGRAFLEVFRQAREAAPELGIDQAIGAAFLSRPNGLVWPTDADVIAAFRDERFYGRINQERIRMLLGPIDRHLQNQRDKGEQAHFDYDKLTIEHIMPRAWKANWPVEPSDPALKQLAEEERERHINRIGNLTLVTNALNPSISNGPWDKKRASLQKHSKLALNEDVVECEFWNEDTITRRARDLAGVALTIWPGPPNPENTDLTGLLGAGLS